jgi:hypothetical protein
MIGAACDFFESRVTNGIGKFPASLSAAQRVYKKPSQEAQLFMSRALATKYL